MGADYRFYLPFLVSLSYSFSKQTSDIITHCAKLMQYDIVAKHHVIGHCYATQPLRYMSNFLDPGTTL